VRQLHLRVAAELRGLSAEAGAALLLSLCNRCVAMLHGVPTRPLHTQLGALELLDLLLDAAPSSSSGGGGSSGNSGSDTVLIRVANAVRLLLQQHATSDPALLHAAASVLGHLARLGSPLTADLVSFQAKQAFEWLQQSAAAASTGAALAAAEQRQLAAVLVLKQLAANAPTLFNTHAPFFFDLLGGPVQALRVDVREAAVLALRVCLVDMASRSERWRRSCWLKIFEQAQEGMEEEDKVQQHRRERSGEYKTMDGAFFSTSPRQQYRRMDPAARTARIHGSLLLLGELLKHASADFLSPRFRTIADLLMRHRHDSSKTVQRSVLTLLPRVAKINPEQFRQDYLAESVAYVSAHMEADQRDTAFLALGRLAAPMTDALLPSLPALVPKLAASLSLTIGMLPSTTAPPSSTKASSFFGFPFSFAFGGSDHSDKSAQDAEEPADPHAERNWSYRRFTYAAMTCVGQLAEGLGEQFQPHVEPLIDVLMQTGLSQSLVDTLDSIVRQHSTMQHRRAFVSRASSVAHLHCSLFAALLMLRCAGQLRTVAAATDPGSSVRHAVATADAGVEFVASAAVAAAARISRSLRHRRSLLILLRVQERAGARSRAARSVLRPAREAVPGHPAGRASAHGAPVALVAPRGHSHPCRGGRARPRSHTAGTALPRVLQLAQTGGGAAGAGARGRAAVPARERGGDQASSCSHHGDAGANTGSNFVSRTHAHTRETRRIAL
jgi:hypothetical protein